MAEYYPALSTDLGQEARDIMIGAPLPVAEYEAWLRKAADALDERDAEVERLEAALKASGRVNYLLQEGSAEVVANNEKLRKLLGEFKDAASCIDDDVEDRCDIWEAPAAMNISVGLLRRAVKAAG